tara:strand:- start:120 stop:293 length:174 start_codon:yes stop_codon:yes gene_type:complete
MTRGLEVLRREEQVVGVLVVSKMVTGHRDRPTRVVEVGPVLQILGVVERGEMVAQES